MTAFLLITRAAAYAAKPVAIYVADIDTNISGESRFVAQALTEALDTAFTKRSETFLVLERRKVAEVIRRNRLERQLQSLTHGGEASRELTAQFPEFDAVVSGELRETRLEGAILTISITRVNGEKPWQRQRSRPLLEWLSSKTRAEEADWLAADAATAFGKKTAIPHSEDGAQGIDLAQKGNCDRALPFLLSSSIIDGSNAEVFFWLGHCQLEQGSSEDAGRSLTEALARNPGNPLFYAERARSFLLQELTDRALQDVSRAIGLDRRNRDFVELRGDIWMKSGNYESAVTAYAEVYDEKPTRAVCGKLADSFRRNGSVIAAEKQAQVCEKLP